MIFGPIKILMKLIILVLVFIMFVVFHNTDFGARMEQKIGLALEYENLRKVGLGLYSKTAGSPVVEENTKKMGKELKKQVERLKESDVVKKLPAKAEKIVDEERKRLENIIEGGG